MANLLEVKDLEVSFKTHGGEVQAVRGVTFSLNKGEVLAVVGESGSGKSVTAQTIMRLIACPPAVIKNGSIRFDDRTDILSLTDKQMEAVRGSEIGMIFQDPMTSLNPTMTVGRQIAEGLIKHQALSKSAGLDKAVELLQLVGIANAKERANQYPHQFSGGMRQRVVIAIALACNPKLLIADEPTTALDVTVQAQILDLLKELCDKLGSSILMITHDLGVVANIADKVIVMYAGKVVERGTARELFYDPKHPYTWGLLRSIPRLDTDDTMDLIPIEGTPPNLLNPPQGCAFAARCPYAMDICTTRQPEETAVSESHAASCWLMHSQAPKVDHGLMLGGANR
ncbi:MAG: peptide transporter ATP-binding protein [Bacilli bacterium]|nr:peptide transporter ATP-binding protein [Bacilli bacterium]